MKEHKDRVRFVLEAVCRLAEAVSELRATAQGGAHIHADSWTVGCRRYGVPYYGLSYASTLAVIIISAQR